jgi:hypothetical protein
MRSLKDLRNKLAWISMAIAVGMALGVETGSAELNPTAIWIIALAIFAMLMQVSDFEEKEE